jgi:hypothetical protein
VKLTENTIASDGIDMEVAEGTTHLNFRLSELEKKQSSLAVEANVKNANIRDFFLYFDNFNQDAVVADNLTGFISSEVIFNALVDDNYSVIPPTMRGSINSRILEGGLLNFEPLENVGNFLFRKRDFSDIQFAQLNSNFTIDGTALDISRMEIQSSVLTLFLQGRYSFSDSTNLSVQLPLSNLKKRHKDYKPENIGVDADAGASVYLHVYRYDDPKGKINIAYDPFKKWAKRIGKK